MSLPAYHLHAIPAETVRVARAAFPQGTVSMTMRDELVQMDDDTAFAALVPTQGRPAPPPWRLALILVMQFAAGRSDRPAADAVRARIDGKDALGPALTDPGMDASVLSECRGRVVAGGAEPGLLDALLARFRARGPLKAGGRQRTDSTHVLAAVRGLTRLECVGATLRHALNGPAVAAPDWLRSRLDPAWVERSGPRLQDERLPQAALARQTLAEQIGADRVSLLTAIDAETAELAWLREVPALQILRWGLDSAGPDHRRGSGALAAGRGRAAGRPNDQLPLRRGRALQYQAQHELDRRQDACDRDLRPGPTPPDYQPGNDAGTPCGVPVNVLGRK